MTADDSHSNACALVNAPLRTSTSRARMRVLRRYALGSAIAALLFVPAALAQNTPKAVIDQDCSAFAISPQNDIVYSVPHLKFIQKYILERDDVFVATANGKFYRIIESDKFIPAPPIVGYTVHSLSWSPDGKRIAVNLTLQPIPPRLEEAIEEKHEKHKNKKKRDDSDDDNQDDDDYTPPPTAPSAPGGNAVALFNSDGQLIQVTGAKSQFIDHATNATWLADDQTVAYTDGAQLMSVRPADGTTTKLFEGHSFQAVAWDPAHNRAFAVGEDITVQGGLYLVALDLLKQTVTPIAALASYESSLTVSPSGRRVGFFANGDTIEVINVNDPSKPLRVNAGLGFFQFDHDEEHILLKRGKLDESNDLVWVGLEDDSFVPALHDLEYHAFQIAPDGYSLAVTEPGKRILKIFPLE
jgi:hypothetical protein